MSIGYSQSRSEVADVATEGSNDRVTVELVEKYLELTARAKE